MLRTYSGKCLKHTTLSTSPWSSSAADSVLPVCFDLSSSRYSTTLPCLQLTVNIRDGRHLRLSVTLALFLRLTTINHEWPRFLSRAWKSLSAPVQTVPSLVTFWYFSTNRASLSLLKCPSSVLLQQHHSNQHTAIKVKVNVRALAIAPLTWVRLVTTSALQSRKWQLIGMSQWCRSALCGHPLPALTDDWTHGAASRHTIATISHTRPSSRSRNNNILTLTVGVQKSLHTPYYSNTPLNQTGCANVYSLLSQPTDFSLHATTSVAIPGQEPLI